jgi:signal transduction histidine kinase
LSTSAVEVKVNVQQDHVFLSDSLRIRTVLRNLISNAIKFYNPRITNPLVWIKITSSANAIILQVEDNGIGMNDSDLVQLFHLFHRANEVLSGSGLGLYTVKCMVEKLGGKIDVRSEKGAGSEFTIEFTNHNKP